MKNSVLEVKVVPDQVHGSDGINTPERIFKMDEADLKNVSKIIFKILSTISHIF